MKDVFFIFFNTMLQWKIIQEHRIYACLLGAPDRLVKRTDSRYEWQMTKTEWVLLCNACKNMIIFTHSTQGTFFSSGWGTAGHKHQREAGDVAVRCLTLPSIILSSHESGLLTAESSDGGSCDQQQFLSPVCRSNTSFWLRRMFISWSVASIPWLALIIRRKFITDEYLLCWKMC